MPLFNYKGVLNTGYFRLYCWQYAKKSEKSNISFNPLGTVINSNESGPCLAFELDKVNNRNGGMILYPSEDIVFETAARVIEGSQDGDDNVLLVKGGKQHKEQMEDIIKRDSLASMYEEDKELLWKLRYFIFYL